MLLEELQKSQRENNELLAKSTSSQSVSMSSDNTAVNFDGQALCSTRNTMEKNVEESRFLTSMNQLSVASININECKPSDDGDIHRQSFELWKDLLVDSLHLAGIEDELTKFTVFKVKAGQRLLEIYRSTQSSDGAPDQTSNPFSNALHRLRSYFGSGSDILLMRRKLATMTQGPTESDLSFITRVGSTARLCEFEAEKEFEQIADRVAEHARDRNVRTAALKMLSRKKCFTDLVDKVREIEAIKLNEDYITRNNRNSEQYEPVRATTRNFEQRQMFNEPYGVRSSYNRGGSRGSRRAPRGRWPLEHFGPMRTVHREKCWRCNSMYHTAFNCSTINKCCDRCGRIGHIKRACRSREPIQDSSRDEAAGGSSNNIAMIEKKEETVEGAETVSDENI